MRHSQQFLLALGTALVVALASELANAAVLYSSGPSASNPYNESAYNISDFVVTDRFTLGAPSTIAGIDFSVWIQNETLQSVDWAITTSPFGGMVEGSGTATSFTTEVIPPPSGLGSYIVTIETFSLLAPLNLAAGNYWLQFSNGMASNGQPVFWDVADTSGNAQQRTPEGTFVNDNFSETFEILGPGFVAPIPLPATLPLFATGLGVLGLLGWRRKRRAQAAT